MATPSLEVVKVLPRTYYGKGDNSGRKLFLRTATTRGGNDEVCLSGCSFPLQVGSYRGLPGLSTCGLLVFSHNDERLYNSLKYVALLFVPTRPLALVFDSPRQIPRFLILRQ